MRTGRGREAPSLAGRFCTRPFDTFELHEDGGVHLCCPNWLSLGAGNLHASTPVEIWNSPAAQAVRRSILDGSFRYCDREQCPYIQAGTLPSRAAAARNPRHRDIIENDRTKLDGIPAFLNLCYDKSCNLSCPSCRTARIQHNDGPEYEARKRLHDRLVEAFLSRPTDQPFVVSVTGSGDPFASRIFREFLYGLDKTGFPRMRVHLQTNGVLFTEKTWNNLKKIHGAIGTVLVSFDAATAETYARTRCGGDWKQLMENAAFLGRLRREGAIGPLLACFVVQRANFREMPQFVEIAKRNGFDRACFARVVNWGTWSRAEFADQCVWRTGHPQYRDFVRVIADPIFDDPIVSLGNVAGLRRQAQDTARAESRV
jgi:sulfatase maturation enzyme AslB (radical SAM superfamily)